MVHATAGSMQRQGTGAGRVQVAARGLPESQVVNAPRPLHMICNKSEELQAFVYSANIA